MVTKKMNRTYYLKESNIQRLNELALAGNNSVSRILDAILTKTLEAEPCA